MIVGSGRKVGVRLRSPLPSPVGSRIALAIGLALVSGPASSCTFTADALANLATGKDPFDAAMLALAGVLDRLHDALNKGDLGLAKPLGGQALERWTEIYTTFYLESRLGEPLETWRDLLDRPGGDFRRIARELDSNRVEGAHTHLRSLRGQLSRFYGKVPMFPAGLGAVQVGVASLNALGTKLTPGDLPEVAAEARMLRRELEHWARIAAPEYKCEPTWSQFRSGVDGLLAAGSRRDAAEIETALAKALVAWRDWQVALSGPGSTAPAEVPP